MMTDWQQQARPRPQPRRKRRAGRVIALVLVALLLAMVGLWVYLDMSLNRTAALKDYSGRPADSPGMNWLIVGSDSREGLTVEEQDELATGDPGGRRTDTIMLMHIPDGSGPATLVSLPRDSFVQIPGKKRGKLNAAFAFGGPQLIVQTVETATNLHIDHYAEIGFGGFVEIVDAIGGVDMCLDKPMKDPKAGLDLQAGCQELSGGQALGYVRTRATPRADLERVERQRQFLSALMAKATGPSVYLNPFRSVPLVFNVGNALTVDEGDHLHHLASMAFAMGGDLVTTTVPVGSTGNVAGAGSVVQWDKAKSQKLFDALRQDQPVPQDVLTQQR